MKTITDKVLIKAIEYATGKEPITIKESKYMYHLYFDNTGSQYLKDDIAKLLHSQLEKDFFMINFKNNSNSELSYEERDG